jgi:hypothetical protein
VNNINVRRSVRQKKRLLTIVPVRAKKWAIIVLALSINTGASRLYMSGMATTSNHVIAVCITYMYRNILVLILSL